MTIQEREQIYLANPKKCKGGCGAFLTFEQDMRMRDFCSGACRAQNGRNTSQLGRDANGMFYRRALSQPLNH